jgi:hypothetical protein
MSPQQLVALIVRLFALAIVVMISFAYGAVAMMADQAAAGRPWYGVVFIILPLVVAALLWTFPLFVAAKLVPRSSDTVTLNMSVRQASTAATGLLGLCLIVTAIPDLVGLLAVIGEPGPVSALLSKMQVGIIVGRLACGIVLIRKPGLLADRLIP